MITRKTRVQELIARFNSWSQAKFYLEHNQIDVRDYLDEHEVYLEQVKRAEGFLIGIQKKLSNERFVNNAPEKVIELERKKESDTLAKIETIKSSLASLK